MFTFMELAHRFDATLQSGVGWGTPRGTMACRKKMFDGCQFTGCIECFTMEYMRQDRHPVLAIGLVSMDRLLVLVIPQLHDPLMQSAAEEVLKIEVKKS